MKVAYITSVFLPAMSAQSEQILNTTKALEKELGADFQLYAPLNEVFYDCNENFINRIPVRFRKGRVKYFEVLFRLLFIKVECDAVYTRDILIAFLFAILGKKVIYEAHQPPSYWVRSIIKILRYSNRFSLAVISNALSKYFVLNLGFPRERIVVIRSGVELSRYKIANQDMCLERDELDRIIGNNGKFLLVHTGSISLGRGAEIFSDILNLSTEVFILQIGGRSDQVDSLTSSLPKKQFYGIAHVDSASLPKYQMLADALLFPMTSDVSTYWCCSPMKLMEYGAARKPLISTNVGSVAEIVDDSCAWIVEERDAFGILSAIEAIKADKDIANKKSDILYSKIQEWDWKIRAELIIRSLAGNNASR